MKTKPSPRPWYTAKFINGIVDANNETVAESIHSSDAALIVDAVNHIEIEREIARQLATAVADLLAERDRAYAYADAAPHPGSASWKVMQAAFRDTAELRSTMERIYRIACDAFNAPGRDLEASMSGALDTIIGAALLALGMKEADND